MRLSYSLGSLLTVEQVLECSRKLNEFKPDTVWIPETWGMENFSMLSMASRENSFSKIGSSIVNIYSRSPSLIAMGAATVDTISNKRLVLGLGTSSKPLVEDFHGDKLESPLKRMKEYVEIIRLILSGKTINYSGEILMSHMMEYILQSQGIKSKVVGLDNWPIITDSNIESTNFLASESNKKVEFLERLLDENQVITIGGFIGRTADGVITTYERGGSDRTAADLGILLHKKFDVKINLEKDSSVVSADPRIVKDGLTEVHSISYNEARLAGMFGMNILDPISIKEILENGASLPIVITDMRNPEKTTTIERKPNNDNGHPIKIITGKKNCAILRIEDEFVHKLLESLENKKRYSEFVILSPFTKDGIKFSRILFLDADYVKRNEKYVLGFDPLATITYNRGVITLIGDEMWRVQQIVSKTSAKIGESGLNILNIDAQEETSRIIVVVEDSGNNIEKAISSIHEERSNIKFI